MNKKIYELKSPNFKNEKRKLLVLTTKNFSKKTSPVFFIYDGQILKLNIPDFNRYDGIEIEKHLKNNKIFDYAIISIQSMNDDSKNKYEKRKYELLNKTNDQNNFLMFTNQIIKKWQKTFLGPWFGFGFSLTASLIMKQNNSFKWIISISPSRLKKFNYKNVGNNISVFYGKKEYKKKSKKIINKPIKVFQKDNPKINVIEYKKMKHTFSSWNNNFDHIIKSTISSLIFFNKINKINLGKYIHGSSNISFINDDIHLKIFLNGKKHFMSEINFLKHTHYKNDYKALSENAYFKKYYNGIIKTKLKNNDIIILSKELSLIHKSKYSKDIQEFIYNDNVFDEEKKVMSHGDLNSKNILFSPKKAYLIDFEWSRLHSPYWDIVSIFKKFKLTKKQINLFMHEYKLIQLDMFKVKRMAKIINQNEKKFWKENEDYFITN